MILLGALAGARKPVVRDASVAPTALADLSTTSDDSKDQTHALANDESTTAGAKVSMTTGTEVKGIGCSCTAKDLAAKDIKIANKQAEIGSLSAQNSRLQTEMALYAERQSDLEKEIFRLEAELDDVKQAVNEPISAVSQGGDRGAGLARSQSAPDLRPNCIEVEPCASMSGNPQMAAAQSGCMQSARDEGKCK